MRGFLKKQWNEDSMESILECYGTRKCKEHVILAFMYSSLDFMHPNKAFDFFCLMIASSNIWYLILHML